MYFCGCKTNTSTPSKLGMQPSGIGDTVKVRIRAENRRKISVLASSSPMQALLPKSIDSFMTEVNKKICSMCINFE